MNTLSYASDVKYFKGHGIEVVPTLAFKRKKRNNIQTRKKENEKSTFSNKKQDKKKDEQNVG